jgi:hypothetical protein
MHKAAGSWYVHNDNAKKRRPAGEKLCHISGTDRAGLSYNPRT